MRPDQASHNGVYFDLPAYADIEALDTLLTVKPDSGGRQ
jgi:hypothetical protein